MAYRKWTDNQLADAVRLSFTISEVAKKLGLKQYCGNRNSVKNRIKHLNLDTSHFYENTVPTRSGIKKPLNEILVIDSDYSCTNSLKRRLLKEGFIKNKCYECGITHWRERKLSLHLDHINGINNDNRLENLRLLCPNCHSLTPTYGGKNIKTNQKKIYKCPDCDREVSRHNGRCVECSNIVKINSDKNCKINWPPIDELIKMVEETNYLQVSKKLGVSDNAVRKRIRTRSIYKKIGRDCK